MFYPFGSIIVLGKIIILVLRQDITFRHTIKFIFYSNAIFNSLNYTTGRRPDSCFSFVLSIENV